MNRLESDQLGQLRRMEEFVHCANGGLSKLPTEPLVDLKRIVLGGTEVVSRNLSKLQERVFFYEEGLDGGREVDPKIGSKINDRIIKCRNKILLDWSCLMKMTADITILSDELDEEAFLPELNKYFDHLEFLNKLSGRGREGLRAHGIDLSSMKSMDGTNHVNLCTLIFRVTSNILDQFMRIYDIEKNESKEALFKESNDLKLIETLASKVLKKLQNFQQLIKEDCQFYPPNFPTREKFYTFIEENIKILTTFLPGIQKLREAADEEKYWSSVD